MSSVEASNDELVLLNTFHVGKKRYRVIFHKSLLIWEKEHSKKGKQTIPLTDIISVNLSGSPTHRLNIYYAVCANSSTNKWRHLSKTFSHSNSSLLESWQSQISSQIGASKRPHHLLVFINPFGGKRAAEGHYSRYCQPLFKLAGITCDTVVTTRAGQIYEAALQLSPDHSYDGIICCGGDGTFAELVNGLLRRESFLVGSSQVSSPKISLGILPAGSTDTIAHCLHGSADLETCALHIILGQTGGLDVSSVSSTSGPPLKYYMSCLSYGYLGDIARESEQYRWMGPKRYDYAGVKNFVRNKSYEAELELLMPTLPTTDANDPNIGPECSSGCVICDRNPQLEDSPEKWLSLRGNYFMVTAANISCKCHRAPRGVSPYCHLGDGFLDVVVASSGDYIDNIKVLLALSGSGGPDSKIGDLENVEVFRTRAFRFKTEGSSSWNCDGEVLQASDVTVRSHRKLIQVYMRGANAKEPLQTTQERRRKFCCC